jgi:phage-related protein
VDIGSAIANMLEHKLPGLISRLKKWEDFMAVINEKFTIFNQKQDNI